MSQMFLTGARGPKGDQGPQGNQGPQGDRGLSASGLAFRRKLHLEVPFHTQTILDMEAAAGATTPGHDPLVYPQSFAVDEAGNELFIWHSKPTGGYVVVRDFTTGAEKKTFYMNVGVGRETLAFRNIGGTRFLYVVGSGGTAQRVNIDTAANGGTVTPSGGDVFSPTLPISTQMCWTGRAWLYMTEDNQNPGGVSTKTRWVIANSNFAEIGRVDFPLGVVGAYHSNTYDLPKTQGVAFHKGQVVFGMGGDYRPAGGPTAGSNVLMSKKQGLAFCTPNGDLVNMALGNPNTVMDITGTDMLGRTIGVHENEGVYSTGENLFAIWQVLDPAEWQAAEGLQRGVLITQELCADADAIDYRRTEVENHRAFDQRRHAKVHATESQVIHPITGAVLGSFDDVIDMMIDLGIDTYRFYGTGIAITDINGDIVNVSGSFVTFEMAVAAGCNITIEGAEQAMRYWVHTIGGARGQFKAAVKTSTAGDLLVNFDNNDTSSKTSGAMIRSFGRGVFITEDTHALEMRRTTGPGYLAAFYDQYGALSGGIYQRVGRVEYILQSGVFASSGAGDPNGAVSASPGSTYHRTDGGAGTSFYVKESGVGNTGWVAK